MPVTSMDEMTSPQISERAAAPPHGSPLRRAAATFAKHWPEYAMEAAELGIFMISACVFTVLLEHPASPVRTLLPDPFLRRALTGLAMAATAIALIFSPWGKQSGEH